MKVIDADAHIIEPETLFDELPGEFHPRRPILVSLPQDTVRSNLNTCWILDGKTHPLIGARGRTTLSVVESERVKLADVSKASATLSDPQARLRDMDRFEIDLQVIFPTLFLVALTEDVKLEGALFEAYNTYLARACAASKGRLRWAALLPFRDPEAAIREMRRVSGLGAAGIFTMGMVSDRSLDDPAFYPIYEEAETLDLPLCVHLGWAIPQVTELFYDSRAFFCSAITPVIWALTSIMGERMLARFSRLRVGFLETGSAWVPYVIQQLRRRFQPRSVTRPSTGSLGDDRSKFTDPAEYFRSGRAFVNCEGDEDIGYLLHHLGEDALMCSSDFPHGDPSVEEDYVSHWRVRTDLSERIKEKALGTNAEKFFRL